MDRSARHGFAEAVLLVLDTAATALGTELTGGHAPPNGPAGTLGCGVLKRGRSKSRTDARLRGGVAYGQRRQAESPLDHLQDRGVVEHGMWHPGPLVTAR